MNYRKQDVAGAVILYNSPDSTVDNINTYIDQVSKLYVIDNSVDINWSLVETVSSNPRIKYYSLNGNQGIASALNFAAEKALSDGYTLLLTMDDDTRTPLDMVSQLLTFWNRYTEKIGILSGVHHDRFDLTEYRSIQYTLTSGNLLNLKAYEEVGRFMDSLFIDHVDHEYGFRLLEHGYTVIELPSIHLDHALGYSQIIKIGNWQLIKYGTNSPVRLYYYARNGLYIAKSYFKEHPDFLWMYIKEMTRRWIKTLFLDTDRSIRISMLWKGMVDGWLGKLGKFDTDTNFLVQPKNNKRVH